MCSAVRIRASESTMSTPRPYASYSSCGDRPDRRRASRTASSTTYMTCLKPIQVQMLEPSNRGLPCTVTTCCAVDVVIRWVLPLLCRRVRSCRPAPPPRELLDQCHHPVRRLHHEVVAAARHDLDGRVRQGP